MKKLFFITAMLMFTLTSTAQQENVLDDFNTSVIQVYDNDDPVEVLCTNPSITKIHGTYRINGRAVIKKADTSSEMPTEVREALASCQDTNNLNTFQDNQEFSENISDFGCNGGCSNPNGSEIIYSAPDENGLCQFYIKVTMSGRFLQPVEYDIPISASTANAQCYQWNN